VQRVLTRLGGQNYDSHNASITLPSLCFIMDEIEGSDGPPEGLFFAGSDDEEEDALMGAAPETPPASSRASSPPAALFIPGSDDEDLVESIMTPVKQKRRLSPPGDESDGVVETMARNGKDRAPSIPSVGKISAIPELSPEKPSVSPPPPLKKRRMSPHNPLPPIFQPTYLGDILVPNAWSNVSGKGYVSPNDSIEIKRDEETNSKSGSATQGKKKDNKKQISLTAMLKSKPAKSSKRNKADNIVRLFNNRGFGNIFSSSLVASVNK